MNTNGNAFKNDVLAEITVDKKSGKPKVRPAAILINRRGTVEWTCEEGQWEVEVKPYDAGPFRDRAKRKVSGQAGARAGDTIARDANEGGEVRTDPGAPPGARGRYRYSVTVWIDGERYHEDPDVVVGPEEKPDDS